MKKRLLSYTGGATKFIQIVISMVRILSSNYKPTDIIVKSSSAIAVLLVLLGKGSEAHQEGVNLDLSKYFSEPPTDGNGKLTWNAKLRAVRSFLPNWLGGAVNSFGVQDVRPLLKKYLTDEMFQEYKNGDYPNVWTIAVNPSKGKLKSESGDFTEYVCVDNLKDCNTLTEVLALIEASAQIQGFTEGVEIDGYTRFDGGMYFAGAAGFLLEEEFFTDVEKVVSVYSWTDPHFDIQDSDEWKNDIGTNSARISQMLKGSNKYFAPKHEQRYCQVMGIDRVAVDLPDVFKNTYEYNQAAVKEAVDKTTAYMNGIITNDIFK